MYYLVKEAVDYLKSKIKAIPKVTVILGSGLSSLVSMLEDSITIKTDEIPHWPRPTAPMHKGEISFGKLEGMDVALQRGRIHYYEGYSMNEVTFPVRVWGELGVKKYFATNAAGGINRSLAPGDLVLVYDHINYMGTNPLIGPNDDRIGVRFPDMSEPYDKGMIKKAMLIADKNNIKVHKGVYLATTGPTFETPAEYKFFRIAGADAVGMSTAPEVIAARHMGLPCFAMSVITDLGVEGKIEYITHEAVQHEAAKTEVNITVIMTELINAL
jgi:purine-nucleoside phosphorylase